MKLSYVQTLEPCIGWILQLLLTRMNSMHWLRNWNQPTTEDTYLLLLLQPRKWRNAIMISNKMKKNITTTLTLFMSVILHRNKNNHNHSHNHSHNNNYNYSMTLKKNNQKLLLFLLLRLKQLTPPPQINKNSKLNKNHLNHWQHLNNNSHNRHSPHFNHHHFLNVAFVSATIPFALCV